MDGGAGAMYLLLYETRQRGIFSLHAYLFQFFFECDYIFMSIGI